MVASEVRKLAERSQTAAGEISRLAVNSVEVAEKAGGLLTRLVPDINQTAQLVQEISAASSEQDTGARQINAALQQLDLIIQENAQASEEMAATSEELAGQAERLLRAVAFFKTNDRGAHPHHALPRGAAQHLELRADQKVSLPGANRLLTDGAKGNEAGGKKGTSINLDLGEPQGGVDELDKSFVPY